MRAYNFDLKLIHMIKKYEDYITSSSYVSDYQIF